MSRTRNTAPWFVQQNRANADGARHHCGHLWNGTYVPCDAHLNDLDDGARVCLRRVRGRFLEWDPYHRSARDRSQRYWRPERTAVRGALERAIKQTRAGALDDDLPTQQHRHATFGGGWWD